MDLFELLDYPTLWDSIISVFTSVREEDSRGNELLPEHFLEADLARERDLRARLQRVFERCVLSKIPRPVPITADELAEVAIEQLAGIPITEPVGVPNKYSIDMRHKKARYVAFIRAAIQGERDDYDSWIMSDRNFDLGWWAADNSDQGGWFPLDDLWCQAAPTHFYLDAWATRTGSAYRVASTLFAHSTSQAWQHADAELRPIVESIAKTARLSAVRSDGFGFGFNLERAPSLSYLRKGDAQRIFNTCLSAYLGEVDADGDLMPQLRNATICLAEADKDYPSDIALMKIFAAIEALVCKESDKKSESISTLVPALLLQGRRKNVSRASRGEVLKELYGMRSKPSHGNPEPVARASVDALRRCAAGVVRAAVRWRAFQMATANVATEQKTTCGQFQKDILYAQRDGKDVTQVDIDLSELLPEQATPEPDISWIGDLI